MWSAVALLVYVLTTRARGARRAPTAAIAWVMGLALLPYLVLPLFLAFGQRKFKAVPKPSTVSPSAHGHWAAALLDSFGLEPPTPVQTRDERADLVYAVKVSVPNPKGALKIGMPADLRLAGGSKGT